MNIYDVLKTLALDLREVAGRVECPNPAGRVVSDRLRAELIQIAVRIEANLKPSAPPSGTGGAQG